jgi:TetR/AcrR family transcriptional repressor of nem operon
MATMPRRERATSDTAQRVLDVAERLVQKRGFNGFSYADVAKELGITTASLHYHFAGKAQLGEALLARYAQRFRETLAAIAARPDEASEKLAAYADLYADLLNGQRLCLCGMLAADYETLPESMRQSVILFFDENERWLTGILKIGQDEGSLHYEGAAEDAARLILGSLEGAMLVTRPYGETARFKAAARQLIAGLTG